MIKIAKNSTMNSDIKVLSFVYTLSSWNILNQINSWTKLATAFFSQWWWNKNRRHNLCILTNSLASLSWKNSNCNKTEFVSFKKINGGCINSERFENVRLQWIFSFKTRVIRISIWFLVQPHFEFFLSLWFW